MKPPFSYIGGKTGIAEQIVALLPPHEHYVEAYAGSLAVLLAKPPSRAETVNDLHGDLMCFWRMLRDRPADLERACTLTPHSRAEHIAARDLAGIDDLERARRVWVRLTQGRSGHINQDTGWRYMIGSGCATAPAYLRGYVGRMAAIAGRLADVSLECLPALEVIRRYGANSGCLIYADPPYLESVRNRLNAYEFEMQADDDHRELAEALRACKASVVLSGYMSGLYEELYAGWHVRSIDAGANSASGRADRTEVLWSNRPFPAAQADLFSGEAS